MGAPPPSNWAFIGRNSNRRGHRRFRVGAPTLPPCWLIDVNSPETCDWSRIDEPIRGHNFWMGHLRRQHPPPPSRMCLLTVGISSDAEITSIGAGVSRTFEPTVEYPSLIAFVSVTAAFVLHKLLVNMVSEATDRRIEASRSLEIARERLSAKGGVVEEEGGDAASATANVLAASKLRYEDALREEERLRTIIPGVRIEGVDDLKRSKNSSGGLSFGSTPTFLVIVLVVSQIVSLVFLAVYPMAANHLFKEVTDFAPT